MSGRLLSRLAVLAVAGTMLVTTLLITREGLEAVLFLGVQAFTVKATVLALGAALGLLLAAGIAWSWSRFGYRLQMGVVLRVTAIFLVLFLAQLAGVELTLGQQVMVVYLAILGGVGTAGVPSGSSGSGGSSSLPDESVTDRMLLLPT